MTNNIPEPEGDEFTLPSIPSFESTVGPTPTTPTLHLPGGADLSDPLESSEGNAVVLSVLCVDDASPLCLNVIGKGDVICAKSACGVKHRGGRVKLEEPTLYLCATANHMQLHATPTIPSSHVTTEVKEFLSSRSFSPGRWNRMATMIHQMAHPVSLEQLRESMSAATTARHEAKTPWRKNSGSTSVNLFDSEGSDEDHLGFASDSTGELQSGPFLPQPERNTAERLENVEDHLVQLTKEVSAKFVEQLSRINFNSTNISTVIDDIGTSSVSRLPAEFIGPTVWDTFGMFHHQWEAFRMEVNGWVGKAVAKVVPAGLKTWCTQMAGSLESAIQRIKAMESNGTPALSAQRLHALEQRLHQLDATVAQQQPFGFGLASAPATSELDLVLDRVNALELSLQAMLDANASDAVKFGELGFRGLDDALAFVDKHPEAVAFGFVIDFHVFCRAVSYVWSGSPNLVTSLTALKKVGLNSLKSGLAVESFAQPIPTLFHKGKELIKDGASHFDQWPTASQWRTQSSFFKSRVQRGREMLEGSISRTVTDPTLKSLLMLSCSESVTFMHEFMNFIEDINIQLCTKGFKEKAAWALTTQLAAACLTEIADLRAGADIDFEANNPRLFAAHMWLASTRCLDMMNTLRSHQIKFHPAITGKMVQHILFQGGANDAVAELQKELKAVKSEHTTLKATVNRESNKLDTLKRDLEAKLAKKADK